MASVVRPTWAIVTGPRPVSAPVSRAIALFFPEGGDRGDGRPAKPGRRRASHRPLSAQGNECYRPGPGDDEPDLAILVDADGVTAGGDGRLRRGVAAGRRRGRGLEEWVDLDGDDQQD